MTPASKKCARDGWTGSLTAPGPKSPRSGELDTSRFSKAGVWKTRSYDPRRMRPVDDQLYTTPSRGLQA